MKLVGHKKQVQILDVDRDKERVSLGLKQMTDNPWADIEARFPIGAEVSGKITKLLPYGAFIEIEKGVEGLVHVSELSWVKRITRPSDVLELDQEIKAVVLGISTRGAEDLSWGPPTRGESMVRDRGSLPDRQGNQGRGAQPHRLWCIRWPRRGYRRHDPRLRPFLDS